MVPPSSVRISSVLRLLFALCAAPLPAGAIAQSIASEEHAFRIVTLVAGLEHPWGLAFLPDGGMLVTERPGRLRLIDRSGKREPRPIAGLPAIAAYGQGGLLDVALHPRFADNNLVYCLLLKGTLGRVRDVRSGPDGFLYLLVDSSAGALVRLEPADAPRR